MKTYLYAAVFAMLAVLLYWADSAWDGRLQKEYDAGYQAAVDVAAKEKAVLQADIDARSLQQARLEQQLAAEMVSLEQARQEAFDAIQTNAHQTEYIAWMQEQMDQLRQADAAAVGDTGRLIPLDIDAYYRMLDETAEAGSLRGGDGRAGPPAGGLSLRLPAAAGRAGNDWQAFRTGEWRRRASLCEGMQRTVQPVQGPSQYFVASLRTYH